MRYDLLCLLLFSGGVIADESCYENRFPSDILACQKEAYLDSKTKYEFTLNELTTGKIQVELKKSILNAEVDWFNLAEIDCDNYSFYIDKSNITFDITKNECMSDKFKQRTNFIGNLKEMINGFE